LFFALKELKKAGKFRKRQNGKINAKNFI